MRNATNKVIIEVRVVGAPAARRPSTRKLASRRKTTVRRAALPVPATRRWPAWVHKTVVVVAVFLGAMAAVHFADARPREGGPRYGTFQDLFRPAPVATKHYRKHVAHRSHRAKTAVTHRRVYQKSRVVHRATPKRHVAQRATQQRRSVVASTPSPLKAATHFSGEVAHGGSQLISLMRSQIGTNPTGWSRQWCGKYLSDTLRRTGHRAGGNLARGYASYGSPTHAKVGAIAVMPHHVGVVTAVGPGYVKVIAGNHSGRSGNRKVGEGTYSMARVIAFRAP